MKSELEERGRVEGERGTENVEEETEEVTRSGSSDDEEEISEPQHEAVLPSEEAGYLQSDDFRIAKRPAAERRHRPL